MRISANVIDIIVKIEKHWETNQEVDSIKCRTDRVSLKRECWFDCHEIIIYGRPY